MNRVLNALICLALSQQLVAQQAGIGTSAPPANPGGNVPKIVAPPGTTVKLVAIEEVSSATLKRGSSVHFQVWRDVMMDGQVMLPAGTPIDAVVTDVRTASQKRHRDGSIRLRLQDIDAAGYRIRLTMNDDFAPENIKHRNAEAARNVGETIEGSVLVIALAPVVIPMGIAMNTSTHKPKGDELALMPCFHAEVYVRFAQRLTAAQIRGQALTPGPKLAECVDSRESLEFDGAFLEAVNQGRLRVD
ncbi:MAG TPA: hypothetical protein VG225_06480 [Terracidiphilus sp.]|jgi:hypothetical protein|nr:hypothetical protein [Terracidiphilus sp.]